MLKLNTAYPGKSVAPSPDRPQGGSAVNVSAQGAGDGTPLEEKWVNDLYGFFEAVLAGGSVVASGNPDTALASDVLNGLKGIFVQLAGNSQDIGLQNNVKILLEQVDTTLRNGLFMNPADCIVVGDDNNCMELRNDGDLQLYGRAVNQNLHALTLIAGGYINAGATLVSGIGVTSVVNGGTGIYDINLEETLTNIDDVVVLAVERGNGGGLISGYQTIGISPTQVRVRSEIPSGLASNTPFTFAIFNTGA